MNNNTGWLCPRCQKVHSPYSTTCDCKPQAITSGSTDTLKVFKPQYPTSIIGTYCEKCRQIVCACKDEVSDLSAIQAMQLLREQAENRENDTKTTI